MKVTNAPPPSPAPARRLRLCTKSAPSQINLCLVIVFARGGEGKREREKGRQNKLIPPFILSREGEGLVEITLLLRSVALDSSPRTFQCRVVKKILAPCEYAPTVEGKASEALSDLPLSLAPDRPTRFRMSDSEEAKLMIIAAAAVAAQKPER